MKKILKVFVLVFLIFIGLIGVLLAAGFVMKDKIAKVAIGKLSDVIGAPLGVEAVSLSLINDFPMAMVELDGVWIAGADSATGTGSLDTLARIDRLYVSLESKPLLDNIVNIRKVEIEDGYVKYFVDSTGATSYDFLLLDSDSTAVEAVDTTASAPLNLTLDELMISNFRCIYQDDQLSAKADLVLPEIMASAKMDSSNISADLIGELSLNAVAFDGTNVHKLEQLNAEFDLTYAGDSAVIRTFSIDAEGNQLDASGLVTMGEAINVDIGTKLNVPAIEKLLKYAPDGMLEELKLKNVQGKLNLDAKVKGEVGDKLPHVDAKLLLSEGLVQYDTLPVVNNITLNAVATNGKNNDNSTTAVTLNSFDLDFLGNHLALEGCVKNLDKLAYDLKTNLDLDLGASASLVPDTLVQNLSGRVGARLHAQGVLPDSLDDQFMEDLLRTTKLSLNFRNVGLDMGDDLSVRKFNAGIDYVNRKLKIEDLGIHLPDYKLKLINNDLDVRFKGNIQDPATLSLNLKRINLGTNNNRISGNATVNNLEAPDFSLNITTQLDLSELKNYAPDSMVNDMTGTILAILKTQGKLDLNKLEEQLADIVYDDTYLDIHLNNVNLDMPDTIMNVKGLSGGLKLDKGLIEVKQFKGQYAGIDFNVVETKVKNLFNTVIRGRTDKLEVDGIYKLGYLDYDQLMAMTGGGSSESAEVSDIQVEEQPTEPKSEGMHYEIKGKFFVDSVKYEKAMIRGISSLFNAKDSSFVEDNGAQMNEMVITLDKLKYNAFEGSGMSSLKVEITPEEMFIKMKNEVDHINMRQVFKDMDNFGQGEMISHENIAGFISSEGLYLQLHFIGDSLVYPNMRMSGDFSFIDGAIYNYEPVLAMEALPGMRNLDSLRFRPINNRELYIFKNDLVIPKMYVVTNRFDAEFSALQSLGEDFKYLVSVSATQFIGGKSKKRKAKQAAQGDKVADKREDQKFTHVMTSVKDGKFNNDLFVNEKERNEMGRKIRVRKTSNKIQFHPELFHFYTGVEE